MHLSTVATGLLGPLYVQALAAFTTNAYLGITAGSPFTLTWRGDNTPVTIDLLDGPTQALTKVNTVANGAGGSSFIWTPPTSLATGEYVLSITQSGATNYSPQFHIAGGSTSIPAPTTAPATWLTQAPANASSPAAVPVTGKAHRVPNLIVAMETKPLYTTLANSRTAHTDSAWASGVSGAIAPTSGRSGDVSSVTFTSGAERVGLLGYEFWMGALFLGAVVMMGWVS